MLLNVIFTVCDNTTMQNSLKKMHLASPQNVIAHLNHLSVIMLKKAKPVMYSIPQII